MYCAEKRAGRPTMGWSGRARRKRWTLADQPTDGADASRRAIGAAHYHPLSVRRFAPAIKRMQRTAVPASKLACPSAADTQPRWVDESVRFEVR